MANEPMTDQEFKRLRQFIKPFSKLNVLVYKLTGGRLGAASRSSVRTQSRLPASPSA